MLSLPDPGSSPSGIALPFCGKKELAEPKFVVLGLVATKLAGILASPSRRGELAAVASNREKGAELRLYRKAGAVSFWRWGAGFWKAGSGGSDPNIAEEPILGCLNLRDRLGCCEINGDPGRCGTVSKPSPPEASEGLERVERDDVLRVLLPKERDDVFWVLLPEDRDDAIDKSELLAFVGSK